MRPRAWDTTLGRRVGGILNATFDNAAELIITIFALSAGLATGFIAKDSKSNCLEGAMFCGLYVIAAPQAVRVFSLW